MNPALTIYVWGLHLGERLENMLINQHDLYKLIDAARHFTYNDIPNHDQTNAIHEQAAIINIQVQALSRSPATQIPAHVALHPSTGAANPTVPSAYCPTNASRTGFE